MCQYVWKHVQRGGKRRRSAVFLMLLWKHIKRNSIETEFLLFSSESLPSLLPMPDVEIEMFSFPKRSSSILAPDLEAIEGKKRKMKCL